MATRVLIVDDDPGIRMLLKTFVDLEDAFEVVGEAGSSATALEMAAEVLPDLVTMDYEMPGDDGAICIREMKAKWPEMHILAVTSSGSEEAQSMIEAGAYARISKAHMEAVVPALYQVVDLRKLQTDHSATGLHADQPLDLASHFEQLRNAIAAMEDDAAKSIEKLRENLAQRVELIVALRAVRVAAENPRYTPEEALTRIVALASAILDPN